MKVFLSIGPNSTFVKISSMCDFFCKYYSLLIDKFISTDWGVALPILAYLYTGAALPWTGWIVYRKSFLATKKDEELDHRWGKNFFVFLLVLGVVVTIFFVLFAFAKFGIARPCHASDNSSIQSPEPSYTQPKDIPNKGNDGIIQQPSANYSATYEDKKVYIGLEYSATQIANVYADGVKVNSSPRNVGKGYIRIGLPSNAHTISLELENGTRISGTIVDSY